MGSKSRIGLVIMGVLVAIQFLRIDKNQEGYESAAAFEKETKASMTVKKILKTNCYDCHSGQTQYPWYAELAPVSFWLAHHIEEGQEHLDMANWAGYDSGTKVHKLDELIAEVTAEEMPLKSYTWLHGKLSEEEKEQLVKWAKAAKRLYP